MNHFLKDLKEHFKTEKDLKSEGHPPQKQPRTQTHPQPHPKTAPKAPAEERPAKAPELSVEPEEGQKIPALPEKPSQEREKVPAEGGKAPGNLDLSGNSSASRLRSDEDLGSGGRGEGSGELSGSVSVKKSEELLVKDGEGARDDK